MAAPDHPAGAPPAIVVVGSLLDPVITAQREKLVQDFQAYRQLVAQKDELRASHMLLFLMVTMVILLASSWTGLYLARRVTLPIQALAEGTRRISGGDLSHRVEVEADDELGVLVDSFNRMTGELASSKDLLERSNRELTTSNQRLAAERALIAAVLENVAAGVVSIDSQGRIFTCNGAALNMLRQREEDVVGRPFEEAWGDPDRARLAAAVREVGRGGHGSKEVHLTVGGEWKTFELKVTALRDAAGSGAGGGGGHRGPNRADQGAAARGLERGGAADRARDQEPAHPHPPRRRAAPAQVASRGTPASPRRSRTASRSSSARWWPSRGWWTSSPATPACPGRGRRRWTSRSWWARPSTSTAT